MATTTAFAQQPNFINKNIVINTQRLNIRSGPGLNFPVISIAYAGDSVQIIASIGDWYIGIFKDGSVGVISKQYCKDAEFSQGDGELSQDIVDDLSEIFMKFNEERLAKELEIFQWDEELNKIAQLKAQDMAINNYFGHYSNTYGTPFAMLKSQGISYKMATESIAKAGSLEEAYEQILTNHALKANILSNHYNRMGIGLVNSEAYGRIVVQIFIKDTN